MVTTLSVTTCYTPIVRIDHNRCPALPEFDHDVLSVPVNQEKKFTAQLMSSFMSITPHHGRSKQSVGCAIAPKSDGNPEGKGVSGFLLDWYRSQPRNIVAKPRQQVLAELFTSMLALSATFKYRPVAERSNYLYWIDGQWSLSLIAPEEWSDERRAGFVGEFVLQRDMTWTITPSVSLIARKSVSDALRRFYDAFVDTFDTDRSFEEILPFHVQSMPYYQRLYASALSRSMRTTVTLGGQASTTCREWYMSLPHLKNVLPAYGP